MERLDSGRSPVSVGNCLRVCDLDCDVRSLGKRDGNVLRY